MKFAVKAYILAIALMEKYDHEDPIQFQTGRRRQISSWLRAARVFEISASEYTDLYHEAQDDTTLNLLGRVTARPKTHEGVRMLPFEQDLPFDSIFIGFDKPVWVPPDAIDARIPEEIRGHPDLFLQHGEIYGFLVHHQGAVEEFIQVGTDPDSYMFLSQERDEVLKRWLIPETRNGYIIPRIIQGINAQRTTILESHGRSTAVRQTVKRLTRETGISMPVPPKYYPIKLQQKVHSEKEPSKFPAQPKEWSHRWDVRAHERVFVRRGPLPISPKDRDQLEDRGYKIYAHALTEDDRARLIQRRLPLKRTSEWVALKVTWVESHVKGPPEAPYVPAMRKLE